MHWFVAAFDQMTEELADDTQKKEVQEEVVPTAEIEILNVATETETVSEGTESGKKLPAGSIEMSWKHPKWKSKVGTILWFTDCFQSEVL